MPGRSHVPDLTERIVRTLRSGTMRTAGGLASNPSPSLTRDRVAASIRAASSGVPTVRQSWVDDWSITGTGTATFTTTFVPIFGSWNLHLNGVRVHKSEFTVTGKTVTILSPTDLFKAAATQGSPWELEMEYDYLAAVPTAPSDVSPAYTDINFNSSTAGTVTAPTGLSVGDVMVLYAIATDTISGGPSGWTALEAPYFLSDGARTHATASWWKVATSGDLGATFTVAGVSGSTKDLTVVCVSSATTVHASAFSHGAFTTSLSFAAASSSTAGAVILRVGAARQSSGAGGATVSQGTVIQSSATGAITMFTTVTQQTQATAGTVAAATITNSNVEAMSSGVFVIQ